MQLGVRIPLGLLNMKISNLFIDIICVLTIALIVLINYGCYLAFDGNILFQIVCVFNMVGSVIALPGWFKIGIR